MPFSRCWRILGWLLLALSGIARADDFHLPWFAPSPSSATVFAAALPESIRVKIDRLTSPVAVRCPVGFHYSAIGGGKTYWKSSRSALRIKIARGGVTVGQTYFRGGVVVSPAAPGTFLRLRGRSYRGALIFKPKGKRRMEVIERVPLEEYLYGVLPKEVDSGWPAEALKAQAVVSRTFVLANLDTHSARSYDVSSDVFSQVYGGQTSESTATNKAVDDTRGQVLVDRQGVPVEAFFHSSCGGQTENPRYVWKGINDPPAYLAGVKDAYCQDDPYRNWHVQLSALLIRKRLRRVGVWLGDIQKVNLAKISPSGRAWVIEVVSNKGKALIPGNRFRMAIGPEVLRSTLITKVQKVGRAFRFEGHGWGHGVGFCQWGARGRALAGQSCKEILLAYYPQTRLVDARKW